MQRKFRRNDDDQSIEYLLSILKLSHLWIIDIGQQYAIKYLSYRPDFDVCLKMNLARKYDIEEWIAPAFRALVRQDLNDFSMADIATMGFDTYTIVSRTKERIAKERLYSAYTCPEPQKAQSCKDHTGCIQEWQASWWTGFCRHLLHPEKLITGEKALAKLETAKFKIMSEACLELTLEELRRSRLFSYMDDFVDEGIKELLEIQRDAKEARIIGPPVIRDGALEVRESPPPSGFAVTSSPPTVVMED